ncbi:MAG: hypothetical protein AB7D37_10870 [Desulfovibrio sp.]
MGLRIDVDTSRGISNLKDFRKSLVDTGVSAQLTERELKDLESRFARKLEADNAAASLAKARRQIEEIGKSAGLTQREIMELGQKAGISAVEFARMGTNLNQVKSSAATATSALSNLESIVLKLGAAFAAYKVADYIKDSAMLAARYETLGVVMETVGANAGYTAGEMNATAAALQKTGISMVESRQQATKLVQAHLDLSKATELARLAQDAAVIAGENSSATFARLVDAIQTAQPEMLRAVGLNVNFEASYKKLADQLGTTAGALNENERMQARFNAVMGKAPDIAGVYERAMGTAGKAILSFSRYTEDFQVKMGEAFGPALQQFVDQATISMKAFQDEISRPEAQAALGAMAVGAADLGTNLMRSAVPALQAAITEINRLIETWQKLPAPLQGALVGGAAGFAFTPGNIRAKLYGMGLGALGGMVAFGDAENDRSVQAGLARAKNLASSGTNQIRMQVAVVGPDGKPLGQTVKKQIESAAYSSSDSAKLLSGSGTAEYQLGEAWKKNLGIVSQLQRKIDSGKLSQEDLTRAVNDQREAWGRIGQAQDNYANKMNRGSKAAQNAALAAERFGSQAEAALEQALDQQDQLLAQMGGDSLGAKLAAVDKKYDSAMASLRRSMIGAKGDVSALNKTLEVMGQNKALEKKIVEADAWAKSMQSAASMLSEIGQLSGDPDSIYGGIMTSAQAWEAQQAKRINAISDESERTKQLSELQQAMALKEIDARRQAYESISAFSSKYWDAEQERIEQHLAAVKKDATDETAYKIYAAQQWDEYNKKHLEQQAQYSGNFADTFSARWSLAFGGYKSDVTKAQERWGQMSDSIINGTDQMIDGVAGGFGDMIRNIGNGTANIEDLWRSMLSRMLDAFASFVEELVKTKLKDLVGGWLGTDSSQSSALSGGQGGLGAITGGTSGGTGGSLKDVGKSIGGAIIDSFSSGTSEASTFLKSLSKTNSEALSDVFKTHNISGWNFSDGSTAAGSAISDAIGATSTAGSMFSTVGSVLGVVGGIAGVVGLVAGLFGDQQKEEVRKVASGYNVQYASGKTVTSGVDFYSDGSVVGTGTGDPDVTKKISDAFKQAAENLHDFADALGFTVDVLDGFQMPAMNITDSQIDTYIRNGTNAMAFQALENAGLRGAFDALAQDGEIYIDEVERLSTAFSTGSNKLAAYGYDMAAVAKVTQDQIDALREQTIETAAGTSQAIMTMAQSMGATSDQLAELSANASDGSQALAVTNEQLSNLKVADWVSEVEDKVGGEDAFNSIMDTLLKNVFDSIGAYAENLGYYNQMASKYITQLGDDSITVDNFWEKFNTALKNGLDPDQFEVWGKASTWVNSIDSVNRALDQWNQGMLELNMNLDARSQKARGLSYEASLTSQLASAEKELYDAREAGYDATYIARLQEVQALELQSLIIKHQEDYAKEMRDATKRYATSIGDSTTLYKIQMEQNAAELSDLAKTYNWSVGSAEEGLFQAVQRAQWAELIKTIEDAGAALNSATLSMRNDLEARKATIAGYDEEAEALQKVTSFQTELNKAYDDGLDSSLISDLMQTQLDELAKYWKDTIASMKTNLQDLYATQENLMSSLSGNTQTAIEKLYALFTRYQAGETNLADSIISSLESISSAVDSMVSSINDTIAEIRTGADTSTTTADVTAATARSYFDKQVSAAAAGDTNAMSNVTSYATKYLDALKLSTADASVYSSGVDYVTQALSKLSSGAASSTSGISDIATQVTNNQIAEAEAALKRAEVAQLKTTYETQMAQAVASFEDTYAGKYISAFATTGVGWTGFKDLFNDYGYGKTQLARILSGEMNWTDYIGWFLNNYGTGSGYVNWESAIQQWYNINGGTLPTSGATSLYKQALSAYSEWQTLKSQYGFSTGGVVGGDSDSGDNLLAFVNSKERILREDQNQSYERGLDVVSSFKNLAVSDAIVSELKAVKEELKAIHKDMKTGHTEIIKKTVKIGDKIDRFDIIGMPPTRTTSAAL